MLEDKDFKPTPISEIGEFGLIDRVTADFTQFDLKVIKGPGDDCAVFETEGDYLQLISTDILSEGVHFDLQYVPLKHLGYKSVAVNLSDIFAMNGTPFGITVAIAISNRFSVEAMDDLYEGIRFACNDYQVDLLGGDTSNSAGGTFITITILGNVKRNQVVYRSGANEGDLICVSGDLGAAYAGLQILEREKKVFLANPGVKPELETWDYVVGRQLKPLPRKDVLDDLKNAGVLPTSMIDVSDGLASDLLHLCRNSKLGARIYQDKIPLDHQTLQVAEEFKIEPISMALNGGEDYELLFTIKTSDFDKVKAFPWISIIGHMTADGTGTKMFLRGGQEVDVQAMGWNHFR